MSCTERFRTDLVLSYTDSDPDAPHATPLNFRQLTKTYLLFKGIQFYWGDFQRLSMDTFSTKFNQNEGLLASSFELNGPFRKCTPSHSLLNANDTHSGVTCFHHTSINPRVGGYFSAHNTTGKQNYSKEGVVVVLLAEGKPVDYDQFEEEEVAVAGFIFAREVIGFVHQLDYKVDFFTKNPRFEGNVKKIWPRERRERDMEQIELGISSGSIR